VLKGHVLRMPIHRVKQGVDAFDSLLVDTRA
jgi:hypothetical protein